MQGQAVCQYDWMIDIAFCRSLASKKKNYSIAPFLIPISGEVGFREGIFSISLAEKLLVEAIVC